jgi:hypothetical protein
MEYMKKKLLSLQTISSEERIMAILLPGFKVMKYTKPDVAKKNIQRCFSNVSVVDQNMYQTYNKAMKHIFVFLLCGFLISGCGSGGGTSSPVNVVTAPSITGISPQSGGPGTMVVIQGERFGAFQGTSLLTYSGVTLAPGSWSNNMISVTLPANVQSNGTFQVIVNGQTSNQSMAFTISNPVISGISPQTGSAGTQVTITGQYFGASQGQSYVAFNGQQARINFWSNSSISCTVPSAAGSQSGNVSVVVMVEGAGTSNSLSFSLTSAVINNVTPASDNIGALVTIYGSGFGANQSQVNGQVTLGGQTAQVLSWMDSAIQIRVPTVSSAAAHSLIVTVNGRQTVNSFTIEAPIVNSYSPETIGEGEVLTIYGNHFGTMTDIVNRSVYIDSYGQVAAVNYNDNSLSFNWPVSNVVFTQQRQITIDIGGLTTTFTVTAE